MSMEIDVVIVARCTRPAGDPQGAAAELHVIGPGGLELIDPVDVPLDVVGSAAHFGPVSMRALTDEEAATHGLRPTVTEQQQLYDLLAAALEEAGEDYPRDGWALLTASWDILGWVLGRHGAQQVRPMAEHLARVIRQRAEPLSGATVTIHPAPPAETGGDT